MPRFRYDPTVQADDGSIGALLLRRGQIAGHRARTIAAIDAVADSARVTAPALIVTGERALDHVVPVDGSIGYVSLIRRAHGVVLERTGHLGSITRPAAFAAIVRDFAQGRAREVA